MEKELQEIFNLIDQKMYAESKNKIQELLKKEIENNSQQSEVYNTERVWRNI